MVDETWMNNYFDLYKKNLFSSDVYENLFRLKEKIEKIHNNGRKTIILGNGGSASIASHVSVDFSKNAKVRMVNFNETALITCLANDYGFENWMSKALEIYSDQGDQVILISSSGQSQNVVNAAEFSKRNNQEVITFTGFEEKNPLKLSGDLNFWVNSKCYNIVEMVHHIWLLAVCDAIIGNPEYPAN